MRILLAASLYPPETRGPAVFAKQLVEHLEKNGERPVVALFRNVRRLPPGIRHLAYLWRLLRMGEGCDTVVALDPISVGLPALIAAHLLDARLILRVGGDYAWEQGMQRFGVTDLLDDFTRKGKDNYPFMLRTLVRLQSFIARHADRVVAPSEYLKRIVERWGVPAEHIAVIYSVANAPLMIEKDAARREFGFGPEPVVFSLGQLVPWKGFEKLIDAVTLAKTEHPALRLIIVGGGDQRELRRYAAERGFDADDVFRGEISNEAVRKLMRAADVFALNTGYEGLSHALVEAMHAGIPIITTPVGGNTELIENGRTGVLVPFNDVEALKGALGNVLRNRAAAERMGANAVKQVMKFSARSSMNAWMDLLGVSSAASRVLMLSGDANALDAKSTVAERLKLQGEQGFDIDVFVRAHKNAVVELSSHVRVRGFSGSKLGAARRMMSDGRKRRYVMVTAQDPFLLGLIAWRIARRARVPLQLQAHTDLAAQSFWKQALSRFLLRRADCVRVVSQRVRKQVDALGIAAPVSVLPVFIDGEAIRAAAPIDLRALYPQFGKIVLAASRLEPEKDVACAITAMKEIVRDVPEAGLLIAGRGSQEPALKKLIHDLGLDGRVIFMGARSDVFSLYKGADLVLNTSKFEGYGATIVEALAAGCAVVSTDVGVAREAGAVIASRENISGAAVSALRNGTKGVLKLELLSKEEYARAWKKSLLACSISS